MVSVRAGWMACILALSLSASSPVIPLRVMAGPPVPDSDVKMLWGAVSHVMTELVLVQPGLWNADVLIAVFHSRWLNPTNRSLIVRAIGAAHRTDYALVPLAPWQSAAALSTSAESALPDGRVSLDAPNAHITRRNARIVAFLVSAVDDPHPDIAVAAVLAYSRLAATEDAMRVVRRSFRRGVLPAGSFMREAFAHLPNLDMPAQEALIDEIIAAEALRSGDDGDASLRVFLQAFFGYDGHGLDALSPAGKAAFTRYLDSQPSFQWPLGPEPVSPPIPTASPA
jgi:hypothetical protein